MTYINRVFDVSTGETIENPLSKEEVTRIEKRIAETQAELAAIEEAAAKKAALLDRLGITADEAKLLLS